MSDKKLKVIIATPDKRFFDDEADMVVVKTTEGELGVLPGHLPIVSVLDIGLVHIKTKGEEKMATLNMGFMQLVGNELSIFTDSAEWPGDIDLERAKEAKKRAEERLKNRASQEVDVERAEFALKRAINRLNTKS